MSMGVEQDKRAEHCTHRASAAASCEQHRKNPARTLRRLKELQASLLGLEMLLAGEPAFGSSWDTRLPNPPPGRPIGSINAHCSSDKSLRYGSLFTPRIST